MKILHILTSINTGGAEKFCVDICNTQANTSENEIYLCVLDKLEDQPLLQMISSNVKLISLNKESGYSLKVIYKIYQLLSEIQPNIIHLNGRALAYASLPIILQKIPSVYTVHTMVDRGNKYLNKYFKFLFNNFSPFFTPVAISNIVLDTVQINYGKQFTEMIYNGSSELKTSTKLNSVRKLMESLKRDVNTLVFIYVGRIAKIKNTLLLIETFNRLLDNDENVCLCIVGYDGTPKQIYLDECEHKNRHPKYIKFVGRKENIADYLSFADAACMTSIKEGLGISALEAFSMGIPLLSTPSGGPPEIIISGFNGYVSEQINVSSYVEIIKKFIEKPLSNKTNIIKLYNDNYTMKICAMHYINLYKKVLSRKDEI